MTLDLLFQKLGSPPPPDVCIDWAIQLNEIELRANEVASLNSTETAITLRSKTDLKSVWQRIQIDESGILTSHHALLPSECRLAIQQLARWSKQTSALRPSKYSDLLDLNDEDQKAHKLDPLNQPRVPAKPATTRAARKNTAFRRPVLLTLSMVASASLVAMLWLYARPNRTPADALARANSNTENVVAGQIANELHQTDQTFQDLDSVTPSSPITLSNELLSTAEPVINEAPSSIEELLSFPQTNGSSNSQPSNPRMIIDEQYTAPNENPSDRIKSSRLTESDAASGGLQADVNRTVLSDLQSATQQAEAEIAEIATSLARPSYRSIQGDVGTELLELHPICLDFEAMRHSFKLNRLLPTIPKEPVWKLTLSAAQGFVVAPPSEQSVDSRAMATWTVYDPNSEPPRTKIVAQARQYGSRRGDLAWRLFATSENLPTLAIPLNRKWREPMLNQLHQFSQYLHVFREQVQLQKRQSNLPAHVRASLSAQRDWVDQQNKSLEHAKTAIAETDRLVDLLDGQFEISGELADAAATSSVILRLGSTVNIDSQPIIGGEK